MSHSPVGVALAGGGPLGAIYEIGALAALDEALIGIDLTACAVYVGVSSGAFLAAGLTNGLTPRELYQLFIEGEKKEEPFDPDVLLRFAAKEYGRRIRKLPRLVAAALADYIGRPRGHRIFESLQHLKGALPLGLFESEPLAAYIQRLAMAPGRTDDFRKLTRKLYIVATDLDTAEPVIFGGKGFDHVPISRAVEASAALPGLFAPVKIAGRYYVDGALQKTLHASAALKEGARLILAINPIVPYQDPGISNVNGSASLANLGLVPVLSQTFRSLVYSRMKIGMERYRHEYPDADIALFEPARDDREIFFANVFSYSNRKRLCEHAYQYTRQDLLKRAPELAPLLLRHGVKLNLDVLRDESRTLTGFAPAEPSLSAALSDLGKTLARLGRVFSAAQRAAGEPGERGNSNR
jgi:predicted acylesterase/phospholipase RssA